MLSNKKYKTYLIVSLFLFSLFGSFFWFNNPTQVQSISYDWWDNNWIYRRKIQIYNNIAEELIDYQVLIELSASEFIGRTQNNGNDIRFIADDQETELDFWIEIWDEQGSTNKIWVKIPSLTGSSHTIIFMYYGNDVLIYQESCSTGFEEGLPLSNGWMNIEDSGSTTFTQSTEKVISGTYSGYVSRDDGDYYYYRTDKWVSIGKHRADGTSFTGHIYATYGTSTNAYLYPIFVDWNNYIALRLYSDKVYIESKIGGSYTYTQKSLGTQFYGKWWEFSISISGSYASAWVESGAYNQSLDHSWSGDPGKGYAALRTRSWWGPYYFDDLELTFDNTLARSNGIATFVKFDDFETYHDGQDIDGINGWIDSSNNMAVIRNIGDNMVLEVERTSSSDRDNIGNDWNNDMECVVHFDLYPDESTSYLGYMYGYESSGTNIAFVKGQGYDDWYWYDGSSLHTFNPYMHWSLDEWKTYAFTIANNDLICDDGTIHDGGLRNIYTTGIDQWRWQAHATYNSRFYIDDYFVRKFASTEPSISIMDEDYLATIDITFFEIDSGYINPVTSEYEINKGEKILCEIHIENTGPKSAHLTTLTWECESIRAGSNAHAPFFGPPLHPEPYINNNGAIKLIGNIELDYTIEEGETFHRLFWIDFKGYPNGAMNIGEWKINRISVSGSEIATEDYIPTSTCNYYVIPKAKNDGAHAVFIYYLWNSGGPGEVFGLNNNPRDYFEDGYGDRLAGFWAFQDPTNVPVMFDFMICWDDNTWEIPEGWVDEATINEHGRNYTGLQLNIKPGTTGGPQFWRMNVGSDRFTFPKNCGFDVLMMGAARHHDTMGIMLGANSYSFFKAGASTSPYYWKYNIDGTVEHQMTHLFGCISGSSHPLKFCVNNWGKILPQYADNLHEYVLLGSFNPFATSNICDDCDDYIELYWYRFYQIYFTP